MTYVEKNLVEKVLEDLAHLLPTQGPLRTFVHHNTLHAFDQLPFEDAVIEASSLFGAKPWLEPAWYLGLLEQGKIAEDVLRDVCSNRGIEQAEARQKLEHLQDQTQRSGALPQRRSSLHSLMTAHLGSMDRVYSSAIRCASAWMDQGIAVLPFPHTKAGLWNGVRHVARESLVPLLLMSSPKAKELLKCDAATACEKALTLLVAEDALYEHWIREALLTLRGWSGMIHLVEGHPDSLVARRHAKLVDWLALILTLEVGFVEQSGEPWDPRACFAGWLDQEDSHPDRNASDIRSLFHVAWEETVYRNLSLQIEQVPVRESHVSPRIHVLFCIDDREFHVRRLVEASSPSIATWGAPGFFGIDCLVATDLSQTHDFEKHCPVPVTPQHVVRIRAPKKRRGFKGLFGGHSLVRGWAFMQLAGIPAGLRMLIGVFAPQRAEKRRLAELTDIVRPFADDPLHGEAQLQGHFKIGYTWDEAAVRVASLLTNIGLTRNFGRLVAVVAHGASSVNNPYWSAYDCGACSGRPGDINARAFAAMANHPEVRRRLALRGIEIPCDTLFLPLIHDTTADLITRLEAVPTSHETDWQMLNKALEAALGENAEIRCRSFELARRSDPTKHVLARSMAWYEPRPEYNHATNFACIVGRRGLSAGISSDRAIFLHSYDPSYDHDGSILRGILSAVVPVAGGINLEYFFSRIDPEVWGSGTKLSQNVAGLFGVMTGFESDLRTGLPTQMTEIHDPLRLLIVVEQKVDLVASVLDQVPSVKRWFEGAWAHLLVVCPDTGTKRRWRGHGFVEASH